MNQTHFDATSATESSLTDAELCVAAAAGNRRAFREIVHRYQNLVCAITYSTIGDIDRSEELAQETFLTAWRNLASLREPARLKGWLCGIARRLASNLRRRQTHDVMDRAGCFDTADLPASSDASPLDQAIIHEEQAILWSVLADISPTYREPLVLYYRGQRSIAEVAAQLDLSEDAVKQRLARGRKLLKAEIAAFVEKSLGASRPGRAFTLAVMASLPGLGAATAVAGTLGASSKAAGPLAAKVTAGIGAALWGPLLGVLGAALGLWAGDQTTRYPRERDYYRRMLLGLSIPMAVFMLPLLLLALGVWNPVQIMGPVGYCLALVAWTIGFFAISMVWSVKFTRRWEQIMVEQVARHESQLPMTPLRRFLSLWEGRQWTSPQRLLGLPLVDIRCSDPQPPDFVNQRGLWRRQTARGWIAVGDRAFGLFAFGNLAIGGVACGGISVGAVAVGGITVGGFCFGGLAIGAVALAGLALGGLACGGFAAGWQAVGGGAFGWRAAQGGLAVAHDFALGGYAIAAHANDPAAQAFLADSNFMSAAHQLLQSISEGGPWFLILNLTFTLLLVIFMLLVGYRRKPV
jgi:RNA polymerase sigma factor (sigma-70 family)